MKIIIQAGGLGTRLGNLTKNKPKGIVAIKNLPILFHLFQKYPKSKFIIIGDYKYDILEKYLRTFAINYDYELIHASGKGNVCGVKEALKFIENNEKFMLIWSDLILSEEFDIEKCQDGNYVGILEGLPCSWSFIDGKLDKIESKTHGVAGCFIFQNKKDFTTIPQDGSFTTWLKESGIEMLPMSMQGSLEIGTIESIINLKDNENRCRPYNKMKFLSDKVIKTGLTQEGEKLIEREVTWYEKMTQYEFDSIPKIFNLKPLTMQKIEGTNIFNAELNSKQKQEILSNLISSVKKMHSYESIPADKDDLKTEYYTKTIDRLESIKNSIPFADSEYININGKKCKNVLFFKKDYEEAVDRELSETEFCPIHGDCTLTNTMVNTNNQIYFIDARGYFGSKKVFGDIRYDWAKLYYSINGNFDQFNIKRFELDILDKEILYKINSGGWEDLTGILLSSTNCNISEIKFIHSIIWLSLASHCWEDYDSMCLAFYNGTYLVNEHI